MQHPALRVQEGRVPATGGGGAGVGRGDALQEVGGVAAVQGEEAAGGEAGEAGGGWGWGVGRGGGGGEGAVSELAAEETAGADRELRSGGEHGQAGRVATGVRWEEESVETASAEESLLAA